MEKEHDGRAERNRCICDRCDRQRYKADADPSNRGYAVTDVLWLVDIDPLAHEEGMCYTGGKGNEGWSEQIGTDNRDGTIRQGTSRTDHGERGH